MPRALSPAMRRAIWNRSRGGTDATKIALDAKVSVRTVRRLLRDVHRYGDDAFQASYGAAGVRMSKLQRKLFRQSLRLRQRHPTWGAGRILLELAERYPKQRLPCGRTLERWFRKSQFATAPAGRPAGRDTRRSEIPHEVWQVDAAEQKRLANGDLISWLRFADECSGAVLKTTVFSRGTFYSRSAPLNPEAI